MASWDSFTDMAKDLHEKQGVRGFVLGETHDHVGLINKVKEELVRLKNETGLNTLYVEYVPSDGNDTLQKALAGDPKAQLELRSDFELGWGQGRGQFAGSSALPAQARYDILFAAKDAGLRVIGVDTEQNDFYKYLGSAEDNRLETGDPHMSEQIKGHDDGKPFMFLVGQAHTYKKGLDGYDSGFRITKEGGIDQRLNDMGIRTVSLDLSEGKTGEFIINDKGAAKNSSDLEIILPRETEVTPTNDGLTTLGNLRQLESILGGKAESVKASRPDYAAGINTTRDAVKELREGYQECRVSPGMVEDLGTLLKGIDAAIPKGRGLSQQDRSTHERVYYIKQDLTSENLTKTTVCNEETANATYRPAKPSVDPLKP